MGKSAPEPPDYAAAAQQQADSSREVTEQQTWANRPTLNTPFGQQSWDVTPTWDPSTGQYLNSWTQNTNLTPEAQNALDSQMNIQQGRSNLAESLLGRAQDEYGDTMDWSQFTPMSGAPNAGDYDPQRSIDTNGMQQVDPSQAYYTKAGDAIFNQWKDRNEPQFQQDQDRMKTQLYNQGLKEGDAAFDDAMKKQGQQQSDARNSASMDATIGAGQEASRMYGMDSATRGQQFNERSAGGQFANSAAAQALQQQMGVNNNQNTLRQQQIAEQMQKRGFSLNEINAILTGQQVGMPNMPSFNTAQRSEGVQSLSAAQMTGQAALDSFNAEQQATQGMMSGIAGGAMMMSDRRLKKNIRKIRGKFYVWDWRDGGRGCGVIADEVAHIPGAVVRDPRSGFDMVNYEVIYG